MVDNSRALVVVPTQSVRELETTWGVSSRSDGFPCYYFEELEIREAVISRGYTPSPEDRQPSLVSQNEAEQLFQAVVGDVVPMIEEQINKLVKIRPFLEDFWPIQDNSLDHFVSRAATDLMALIPSPCLFLTITWGFLLTLSPLFFFCSAYFYAEACTA